MKRPLLQALVALAAAGLLVAGLVALGPWARSRLKDEERFITTFDAIECPHPPGSTQADFLAEVQYLARFPDRLAIYDKDLPPRLAEAFARHPWVERIEEVQALPPDRVRVQLVFRTPVLAVPLPEGRRVVDGQGVLLPSVASPEGLPVYRGQAAPSKRSAGNVWTDSGVVAAAAVASLLHPHRGALGLTACEPDDDGLVLHAGSVRILWGRPPGKEGPDEARAVQKVARLLEHLAPQGRLDAEGSRIDLRPREAVAPAASP